MTSHDLYDSSVGGCKALAMFWHARRHAFPVNDIKVRISRDDGRQHQGLYHLIAAIEVSGNLTLEQRSALLDAAAKCPVHSLMNAVRTEITTLMV